MEPKNSTLLPIMRQDTKVLKKPLSLIRNLLMLGLDTHISQLLIIETKVS